MYDPDWPEKRYQSILEMSKQYAWKPYAWHEAKRLEKDYPELFAGITERLKLDMQSFNEREKGGKSNDRD